MKQTFDTDAILFGILSGYTALTSTLSGGVYTMERPDNSDKEDVVVNTITLTQDSTPQIGTSNINVHVSDLKLSIAGKNQRKPNVARLKAICEIVLAAVRTIKVAGLTFQPEGMTTIREADVNQHYVNIRINWNIH